MQTQIVLAHEELLYLIQLMAIPTLPGFGGQPLITTDQETYVRIMGVAERCLRAKGFLDITDEGLVVDTAVAGTLSYCAHNPRALIGIRIPVEPSAEENVSREAIVLHSYDERLTIQHRQSFGLHYFTLFENREQMLSQVIDWMGGGSIETDGEKRADVHEFDVSGALILILRAAASKPEHDDATMLQLLSQLGYSEDDARAAITLLRYDAKTVISFAMLPSVPAQIQPNPSQPAPNASAMMFVITGDGWWTLTPKQLIADNRDQIYGARRSTGSDVVGTIARLMG